MNFRVNSRNMKGATTCCIRSNSSQFQAHPFREGNGRTSKIFMEHIAEQTPFTFDFSRIDPDLWNDASEKSRPHNERLWIDPTPLLPVFGRATQLRTYTLARDVNPPTLEKETVAERLRSRLEAIKAERMNTQPHTPGSSPTQPGPTPSGPTYGR